MTITNTGANNAIINPIDLWRASGAIAHSNLEILLALRSLWLTYQTVKRAAAGLYRSWRALMKAVL